MSLNTKNPLDILKSKNPVLLFITGAGLSAPSGIPTYRGEDDSFYNDKELMSLMSTEALKDENTRNQLRQRLNDWKDLIKDKEPNQAHQIITDLIQTYKGIVCTQNVDDLHEKTGLDSNLIYHMHGSLFKGSREDYPDILDVVLFGDQIKNKTNIQSDLIDSCTHNILVGTSLYTASPFYIINESKPIMIIDKDVENVLSNLKQYYQDDFDTLDLFVHEGDVVEGLNKLKQLILI